MADVLSHEFDTGPLSIGGSSETYYNRLFEDALPAVPLGYPMDGMRDFFSTLPANMPEQPALSGTDYQAQGVIWRCWQLSRSETWFFRSSAFRSGLRPAGDCIRATVRFSSTSGKL